MRTLSKKPTLKCPLEVKCALSERETESTPPSSTAQLKAADNLCDLATGRVPRAIYVAVPKTEHVADCFCSLRFPL